MAKTTLTPERIVDAALAITARPGAATLSGRTIGDELGVDRSAVWRHFSDQDALLRSIGDRLLQLALERTPQHPEPSERMKAFARELVAVCVAHPSIGSVISGRMLQGPGEAAVIEFTLTALRSAGVPEALIPAHQRMLADTILSYAGMRSSQALLAQNLRLGDRQAWIGAHATALPEHHPNLARHVHQLAAVSDDEVLETLLSALWAAVQRLTQTSESAPQ